MKKILYEGPDLSYHNGNVDIKRIRNAGCKRIGLRAGYGKNNVDQKYVVNALACYNLNVAVLLYWFSYAYTAAMSAAEAKYAIVQAMKYWVAGCPIAFDFEYDSVNYARKCGVNLDKATVTDMAIAFLKEVIAAGHIPVIYTNRDYLRNWFDMEKIVAELGTVYVWYARYNATISESEQKVADIWQYTSKGSLPGVSGNVDMNRFYIDFDREPVKAEREATCNINIQNFQKAANADGYRDQLGQPLIEDGIDGDKTQYVRSKILLKMNGLRVGSTGKVVEWVQNRLNEILECNLKIDGRYGSKTKHAVTQFQKKYGLATDGKVGYNTIQGMFYN